jgi:PAS domain S-box-containing protein
MEQGSVLDHFAEEDIYRLILENLDDGVFLVDTQRKITYWNEGAERITGFLSQDVIGRKCDEGFLSHCGENGCANCEGGSPLGEAMNGGRPRRLDAFLRHKLGHRVPISLRAAPVVNSSDKIIGAVEIFHLNAQNFGLAQRFRGLETFGCLDPETGVANEKMTTLRLSHRLEDLRIFGIPLGVFLISLTGQKEIHNRYGQEAWLGLMRAAAQTMAQTLPPNGFVGRWDSARFLVLLGNCDPIMLQDIAARSVSLVHASEVAWWGNLLRPTATVRTTMGEPEDTPKGLADRLIR